MRIIYSIFNKSIVLLLALLHLAHADLPVFKPLVTEQNQQFYINPTFTSYSRTVVDLVGLSYDIAKEFDKTGQIISDQNHELLLPFTQKGWNIIPFSGKTGFIYDDVPGFLAYHSDSNILVIVLHGSRNNADWITNFDAFKAGNETHQLGIPGLLHRGFAIKASQFKPDFLKKLDFLLHFLTDEQIKRLSVFVTGHSQGAALAHLAGVIITQYFQNYFGPEFDNNRQNKVQLYRLSAPRDLGDHESYQYTTQLIGKHNDIRHNVEFDPVPSAVLGKSGLDWINRYCSQKLGQFAGYKSSGYLALQLALPTIITNLIYNLNSFEFDENTRSKLLVDLFGPLHLGSAHNDPTGAFLPALVDSDFPKLLHQGMKHKEERRSIKQQLLDIPRELWGSFMRFFRRPLNQKYY